MQVQILRVSPKLDYLFDRYNASLLGVMPTYTFGIYNIFAYNVASEESVPLWSLSDEWRLAPSVSLLCLSIALGTMISRKRASMVQKLNRKT